MSSLQTSNVVIGIFLAAVAAMAGYALWVLEQNKELIELRTQYGGVEEWRQLWIDDRKVMFSNLSNKVDRLENRVRVLESKFDKKMSK